MSCVLKLSAPPNAVATQGVYVFDPDQPVAPRHGSRAGASPLDRAMAEAKAVIQEAAQEAEQLRQEALERGYAEGLEQAKLQHAAAMKEIDDLNEAIRAERETFFAQIEPQVVRLSTEIAEKILRHELETNPEVMLDMIKFALQQLVDKDSITLRVNPANVELVKANLQAVRDASGGVRQIEVIEDRRVDHGGCVVESASGSLDARVNSQISEITRALTEAFGDNAADTDPGSE